MREMRPPRLAERILQALLPLQAGDALLGDFAEEFHSRAEQNGEAPARRWYWRETFFSTPILLVNLIQQADLRRQTVSGPTFFQAGRKTALWGILLLVPALLIAVPGMLFSFFGYSDIFNGLNSYNNLWAYLVHPAVVLGGLALAVLINLQAVLKLSVQSGEDVVVSTIAIKKNAWNLVPLGLAAVLAVIIFLYLIAENFGPFFLVEAYMKNLESQFGGSP